MDIQVLLDKTHKATGTQYVPVEGGYSPLDRNEVYQQHEVWDIARSKIYNHIGTYGISIDEDIPLNMLLDLYNGIFNFDNLSNEMLTEIATLEEHTFDGLEALVTNMTAIDYDELIPYIVELPMSSLVYLSLNARELISNR